MHEQLAKRYILHTQADTQSLLVLLVWPWELWQLSGSSLVHSWLGSPLAHLTLSWAHKHVLWRHDTQSLCQYQPPRAVHITGIVALNSSGRCLSLFGVRHREHYTYHISLLKTRSQRIGPHCALQLNMSIFVRCFLFVRIFIHSNGRFFVVFRRLFRNAFLLHFRGLLCIIYCHLHILWTFNLVGRLRGGTLKGKVKGLAV